MWKHQFKHVLTLHTEHQYDSVWYTKKLKKKIISAAYISDNLQAQVLEAVGYTLVVIH